MKRVILLTILAIEGVGGIWGGYLLVSAPDGRLMQLTVEMMHGTFPNFLIPGLILSGMGILNLAAFVAVFRRSRIDWILAGMALVGFVIWFLAEIVIIREVHWLQIVWGTPVLIGIWLALPLIPQKSKVITKRVDPNHGGLKT